MPFRPLQAPANMDTDGLRAHGEDQTREIERAWGEMEEGFNSALDELSGDLTTGLAAKVDKAGDTMTGELLLFGDPTNVLGSAPKQYVDAADSTLTTAVATKSDITRTINFQTGTTYTLALTDAGNVVDCTNASAVTVTVPPNSSVAFAVGAQVEVMQGGAGKVTMAQGSGVTINSKSGNKACSAQYVGVTLLKVATDTWRLMGDLTA